MTVDPTPASNLKLTERLGAPALRLAFGVWLLSITLVPGVLAGSGPIWIEPLFWFSERPNQTLDRFLAGEPVVVHGEWDREYLVAAYLLMSAPEAGSRDLAALAPFWEAPAEPGDRDGRAALSEWALARREIVGRGPMPGISPSKVDEIEDGERRRYFFYDNCLPDAFRTAVRRLGELVAVHGAEGEEVARWIAAQDRVFSNCGRGGALPEPVPESATPEERRDRAYQLAAAWFYRGDFVQAAERFGAIAADRESRWSDLAAYLVARCAIRSASLEREEAVPALERAQARLGLLLEDPGRESIHQPARRLSAYVALRLRPVEERQRLAERLAGAVDGRSSFVPQELTDYLWLVRKTDPRSVGRSGRPAGGPAQALASLDDLTAWLRAIDPSLDHTRGWRPELAGEVRLLRWQDERSIPWLVAVGLHLVARHSATEAWLEAAAQVPETSWAAPTLTLLRASLLADLERWDEARRLVDAGLETWGGGAASGNADPSGSGALSLGDLNRFRALRARLDEDLARRLVDSQLPVVAESWGDGSGEHPAEEPGRSLWTREIHDVVDGQVPVERFPDILRADGLHPDLAKAILAMGWTRAVVLDLQERALDLAAAAEARGVDVIGGPIEAFRAAAVGPERRFVGALDLLRNPGFSPWIHRGYGRSLPVGERSMHRWNGWCASNPAVPSAPAPSTDELERRIAGEQIGRIVELGHSQIALARPIFDWATKHPEDPRVPEALHQIVHATRTSACTGSEENGAVSRRAFELLHRRYPDSPWTKKTPYWYR